MVTIPARPDPLVGQILGHYQVLEKIGAGGMGEVYRAHDQHLDREVAIKVLPQGILTVEGSRKRFRKEALALSRLEHPNIATIHDFDEQQGIDFLVMEYIPGVTLSEKVARRPLPEREVVALGVQLAEGLAAAHDRGVIHRDLKPGNFKLTTDGRLKILDFGLAKLRPSMTATATTETLAGGDAFAGTLPYMAPEQVLGDDIDARTDIYGAGAVLYEMATGCRPVPDLDQTQTIAAILHKPPQTPTLLNPAISSELERIITKCLEKDPENRFQSAKELAVDLRKLATTSTLKQVPMPTSRFAWKWRAVAAVAFVLAALIIALGLFFRSRQGQLLKETDTVVLADFVNTTGDPVFDDALKQALTVQLEQSPFLSILPEKKIRDTLRLMAHSPDDRVTPELGLDLCQRAAAKAVLWGSIAPLGTQYVVGLTAADCANGNHLATAQVQAPKKEDVLKSLGSAASQLRNKLGESLASVQKFDAPIEEATTPSLEALNAYSLGRKILDPQGDAAAIPFYERAIDLDPNFVSAYTALGAAHWNLGRTNQAVAELDKAFQLRERVSERERFHISGLYYKMVTGDVERANQTYRQWAQTYPLDALPHHLLAVNLMDFGAWDEAISQYREALRFDPEDSWASGDLAICFLALEKPDAAEAVFKQLVLHTPAGAYWQLPGYDLAFYRGDSAEMQRVLSLAKGKPDERFLLSAQSDTEAFFGKLHRARLWSRRAADSELQSGSPERAALWQVNAALREAEFGKHDIARQAIVSALDPTIGWRAKELAALVLARNGESARADSIVREIKSKNPSDTRLNAYWLPVIQAAIYLNEKNPVAAISALDRTAAYELGGMTPLQVGTLYPAYLRGQAHLMLRDGTAAAAEFQKYLDHRGIVLNYPLGALAHLQLGRAYVMTGDTTKAKTAYQDFLTLWKDADPDIPILKAAKAEYAKLQ